MESEDFGKCFIFKVSSKEELYVPKGFAHGFITTEDNTVVQYLVDDSYSQPNEGSILWSSVPEVMECVTNLNVDELLISDKDKVCQSLKEYLEK